MGFIKHIKIFDVVLYAVMLVLVSITLYPFLNVIAISFNDASDTVMGGIHIWPRVFTFRNYQEIIKYPNLGTAFVNSVLRTVIGAGVGVFLSAMLAYTISRRDFVARKFVSTMFAITMYVSGGMIPGYLLIVNLKLNNTFWVYILPGLIWAFCIFVLRSFIDSLPISLQESAMLDGANDFVIFIRVIFPLCTPALATVALFYAVGHWNSWFDAYLFNSRNVKLTLLQYELQKIIQDASAAATRDPEAMVRLAKQAKGSLVTPQSIQMAITVVCTVPIIIVYPFLQRYFVKGMTLGAVKA